MRYAIYFTPSKDDPLTQAANRWLARDAFDGQDLPLPEDAGLPQDEWRDLTAEPRRYGFHATLKAPFSLASGHDEADLLAAIDAFADQTAAFRIFGLALSGLGPFFALTPDAPEPALQEFAGRIVEQFEPFRAPLSDADIARRKPEKLTERQRSYLEQFGYPYVMDEFRFHMTLTGPVAEERREAIRSRLHERFSAFLHKPRHIDAVAIFTEAERGAPFTLLHRATLRQAQPQQEVCA